MKKFTDAIPEPTTYVHPKSKPLAGNQLAQAIAKSVDLSALPKKMLVVGPRQDEIDTFVVISTGNTAVWRASSSCNWHAAVGKFAVCGAKVNDEDPFPSTFDRSNDPMTCEKCQELVRRVKHK
jgi:hypothetical protein